MAPRFSCQHEQYNALVLLVQIAFFILLGLMALHFRRPLKFAAVYAGFSFLIAFPGRTDHAALLFAVFILYTFTGFIYLLVDYFGDRVVTPLAILLSGAFVWFGTLFMW